MSRVAPFNREHYADPTVYAALNKPSEPLSNPPLLPCTRKPIVYIASALRGDVRDNMQRARQYARFAYNTGVIPFVPHLLYPHFMCDSKPEERTDAMQFGAVMLLKCSQLWAFGEITEGMRREIDLANHKHIPVRFFDRRCEEVKSVSG